MHSKRITVYFWEGIMTGTTKTSATALSRIVRFCPKGRQEQKNVNTPFGISIFKWRKTVRSTEVSIGIKCFSIYINRVFCPEISHGSRNEDRLFPGPKTSTFTSTRALWPVSQQHLEGQWGSSCRIWWSSLPSCWDKWVQKKSRRRNSGSSTVWSWQREYKNFAGVKPWL